MSKFRVPFVFHVEGYIDVDYALGEKDAVAMASELLDNTEFKINTDNDDVALGYCDFEVWENDVVNHAKVCQNCLDTWFDDGDK